MKLNMCRLNLPDHLYPAIELIRATSYILYEGSALRKGKKWIKYKVKMSPTIWESITPKELHLSPGEGPIEIEIRRTKKIKG